MPAQHRTEDLFIVRIWQEPGSVEAAGEEGWRGSVQHVLSGQRIHFRRLVDLDDFIRGRLHRPHRRGRIASQTD
jgi:hypothetical protein